MKRKVKDVVSNEIQLNEVDEMKNINTYNMKISLFVIGAILLAASSVTWADANNNGANPIVLLSPEF